MSSDPSNPESQPPRPEDSGQPQPLKPAPLAGESTSFALTSEAVGGGPVAPPGPPPCPADLVGHPRYRILEYLGSGGMGVVYKAEHRLMEKFVALKVISQTLLNRPAMIERFRKEVRAAGRLAHPNIVAAYDADQASGTHFLVMEFVEGVDLDRVLKEQGALPIHRACDYARQAALGLQHAFERGMVHRDIKPHNLMLTPAGQVKILDFGLARFISEAATAEAGPASLPPPPPGADGGQEGDTAVWPAHLSRGPSYNYTGAGTVDYIAPEEALNPERADIRADLYSLGCTLYRFLTDRVPFPHPDPLEKLKGHLGETPVPLLTLRPEIPARLAQVVERQMAKDPAERFRTPAEVALALAPFAVVPPRPVLIVEDDTMARSLMMRTLERQGYPLACAGNGREALELLRSGLLPSLILLDLMMPVMDGWQFLEEQKRDPALAAIPVVIISAARQNQAEAIALGAAEYLQKPIELEELTAKVQARVVPG